MMTSAANDGLVIASYGQRGILVTPAGERRPYILKGRKLRAVCGDKVCWVPADHADKAIVTGINQRKNALERTDSRGKPEAIAANLTRIVVVLAPIPEPDFFVADRYLCAAEMSGIMAVIAWNKSDIDSTLPTALLTYEQLAYPVIQTSAKSDSDTGSLRTALREGVSMLVGQSGVGKSSLINRLVPDADVTVGELSTANKEGRHTTTASYMHTLPDGGELIDSPGVRDFAPSIREINNVQAGFREILQLSQGCRFSDCQHLREPDCAVKQALETGAVTPRLYESYKRMRNSVAQLKD